MKNKGQEIVICKQEITDWKIAGNEYRDKRLEGEQKQ